MTEEPDKRAGDMQAMESYWAKVDAVMGGIDQMRENCTKYLPKFPDEDASSYDFRCTQSKMTNIFGDIVDDLSQRPFAEAVTLSDDSNPDLIEFSKDVDGKGSNLHNFSADTFSHAISHAIDWFLVDYSKNVPLNATRAQEKASGARPHWVHYRGTDVLAAYTAMINGKEEFIHCRLRESRIERSGFQEKVIERIRILERAESIIVDENTGAETTTYANPTFQVMEKLWNEKTKVDEWVTVEGPYPITIGEIPLVPFYTGRRPAMSWEVTRPMRNAVDLQVDLFQQESGLKFTEVMGAFPMLVGSGVMPEKDAEGNAVAIKTGPHRVLYAPPTGEGQAGTWQWIEPTANTMTFILSDIKDTRQELRELGRQPLTAQSGNLTVISSASIARKGNTAIQAWALNLKGALARGFQLTEKWLKLGATEPTIMIDTDFDISVGADDSFDKVVEMRKNGDISREAQIHEAKRRAILDADYDQEKDLAILLQEIEDDLGGEDDNLDNLDDDDDDDETLNDDPSDGDKS